MRTRKEITNFIEQLQEHKKALSDKLKKNLYNMFTVRDTSINISILNAKIGALKWVISTEE